MEQVRCPLLARPNVSQLGGYPYRVAKASTDPVGEVINILRSFCNVRSGPRRRVSALLAAALLLAVWVEAEHLVDVEAHGGSVCEVCLFTGASGHAMAPAASSPLSASGPVGLLAAPDTVLIPSFLLRLVQDPRAPPVTS